MTEGVGGEEENLVCPERRVIVVHVTVYPLFNCYFNCISTVQLLFY